MTLTAGDIIKETVDPSANFILPADAPYLRNLEALWGVNPKLAAAIEATDGKASYPCEPSRAGPMTVIVPTTDGRRLSLHSRYEPIAEANALIDPINTADNFAFFVHGFALGYHVELLFERICTEAILVVVEPDVLMLRTAFEQRDYSKMLETNRVLFVTEADKADLFVRLLNYNGLLMLGVASVSHPAAVSLHTEFHRQLSQWIEELQSFGRTSLNTLVVNGRRTAENITRNLGWYAASPSLSRWKDQYKGKPAVVVSAGPSLRKNKHLLKDAAGKAVMIAVQTTLQPLLEMGIEPQFVTSLDYHDICTRFFEKLPRTLKTELIAEPKASDRIFELNPGPLTVLGNLYAEGLLREMKLNKASLSAGATVAHLAYYVAEYLGCDPIIFVGQDLGFSDGLCYTPGTSYEDVWRPELSEFCTVEMKQWEQIVRDRSILKQIPDVQGRPMYTEERLFTYLQQFERDFGRTTTRIIDATEGGAFKRGSTTMKLAEAIEKFCGADLPMQPPPLPSREVPGEEICASVCECLISRRREAQEIESIARQTLPLLEEVRDQLQDQARVNRAIARIDVLRERMNMLGPCYDLITELTQLTEMQRFESDRKLAGSNAKGTDRQRLQVCRDVKNVEGIIAAAAEFQKLMTEVIDKLSPPRRREAA